MIDIMIEVTRRCNMSCAHCLRGDSEAKDLRDDVLEQLTAVLAQYSLSIGTLMLTGGEPLLVPDIVMKIIKTFIDKDVLAEHTWLATNGGVLDQPEALGAMFAFAMLPKIQGGTYAPIGTVDISVDQYHNRDIADWLRNQNSVGPGTPLPWISFRQENVTSLISEGRAVGHELADRQVDFSGDPRRREILYITVDGNVTMTCDLSFEHQDSSAITTVFDKDAFLSILQTFDSVGESISFCPCDDWVDGSAMLESIEEMKEEGDEDDAETIERYIKIRCDAIRKMLESGVDVDDHLLRWAMDACEPFGGIPL